MGNLYIIEGAINRLITEYFSKNITLPTHVFLGADLVTSIYVDMISMGVLDTDYYNPWCNRILMFAGLNVIEVNTTRPGYIAVGKLEEYEETVKLV